MKQKPQQRALTGIKRHDIISSKRLWGIYREKNKQSDNVSFMFFNVNLLFSSFKALVSMKMSWSFFLYIYFIPNQWTACNIRNFTNIWWSRLNQYRIAERWGWSAPLQIIWSNPCSQEDQQQQVDASNLWSQRLYNISGNVFQYWITPTVKNLFLMLKWNFLYEHASQVHIFFF